MDMKTMQKTVEKIVLQEPITLEELHELMKQNSENMPGKFKFKKGLFGKSILFDVFMQTQPRITVKENTVTVRRMGNSTSVGVGNMPAMDFKAMKQTAQAVKGGGLGKAVSGGAEYFVSVCDAMVELLQTRVG